MIISMPERLSKVLRKKQKTNLSVGLGGDKRDRTAVVCLSERLSKVLDKEKTPTFRLELVEISGIEPLLFVCLKDSQSGRRMLDEKYGKLEKDRLSI